MKKTLLLFVCSLFLFSCSKDDEVVAENNPLVGKWQIVKTKEMDDCEAQSWIEFTKTTFTEKKVYQGLLSKNQQLKVDCLSLETNYNYTISGDIIKATIIVNSKTLLDNPETKDVQFSISDNQLTLIDNGKTTVYEK